MQTPKEIQKRIDEIKADERLSYGSANIVINAPLALVQLALEVELSTLEKVLGIPQTNIKKLRGETK